MAESKVKEGELTEADLAAYGIPPKPPEVDPEPPEKVGNRANDPDAEASDGAVEKASRV